MDKSPVIRLRKRTKKIEYHEKKLIENSETPPPPSSIPSLLSSRKRCPTDSCFCGKRNKSELVYCYGPNCLWKYVHLKCLGLKRIPDERVFCCDQCREDDIALINKENAELVAFEWCSCKKQRGGEMVQCDKRGGCKIEWYHLVCVGLQTVPQAKWICPDCKKKDEEKAAAKPKRRKKAVIRFSPEPRSVTPPPNANDSIDLPDLQNIIDEVNNYYPELPNNTPIEQNGIETPANNVDPEHRHCICEKPLDDKMIECSYPKCPHEWFHLSCMNLTDFPDPEYHWFCSNECEKKFNETY